MAQMLQFGHPRSFFQDMYSGWQLSACLPVMSHHAPHSSHQWQFTRHHKTTHFILTTPPSPYPAVHIDVKNQFQSRIQTYKQLGEGSDCVKDWSNKYCQISKQIYSFGSLFWNGIGYTAYILNTELTKGLASRCDAWIDEQMGRQTQLCPKHATCFGFLISIGISIPLFNW